MIEETTVSKISDSNPGWIDMHTLSDQAVQVLVVWSLDTEVATADVIDGLVVDHEAAV